MWAYIYSYGETAYADNENAVVELPEHEAGDYLVIFSSVGRVGSWEIDTKPVWWTDIISTGSTGIAAWVGYIKATSSSMTNPTIGHLWTSDVTAKAICIRWADQTTFIDISASTATGNVIWWTIPSITTTSNGEMVFYWVSWNDPDEMMLVNWNTSITPIITQSTSSIWLQLWANVWVWYDVQDTAWATPTQDYYNDTDTHILWSFAIKNASGNSDAIRISSTDSLVYRWDRYEDYLGSYMTWASLSWAITTLETKTVASVNLTSTGWNTNTDSRNVTAISFDRSWTSWIWEWIYSSLPSTIDLSQNRVFTFYHDHWTYLPYEEIDYSRFIIFDSSWNWNAYVLDTKVAELESWFMYRVFMNFTNLTPTDSSWTIDLSDIDRIGFAWLTDSANTRWTQYVYAHIGFLWKNTFTWGNSVVPITPREINKIQNDRSFQYGFGNQQWVGQDTNAHAIQIGDGTTPTYYSNKSSSFEWRRNKDYQLLKTENSDYPFEIYASANDTIDFSSSITASSGNAPFIINASSSLSATYRFNGWNAIGLDITWLEWIPIINASFIKCSKLTIWNTDITWCFFSESASTDYAISIDLWSYVKDCDFTKGSENYAIEITEAGDYTMTWNTFSWYTNDLYISATTWTVNITIDVDDTTPTYQTAGATVNITKPQSWYILEFPNILSWSRIQVYNVTTWIELTNEIISGTFSESYTEWVDYVAGDIGRYRIAYTSGATGKQEIEWLFTFSAGNNTNSNPITQEDCVVYNTNAIDWSTITAFSADYTYNEIDIVVGSNFSVKELYAWWKYNLTTANGIRNFFGGITPIDTANYQVNTATVSIYIDNTTTSHIYQTDNVRFFRDDNAYPVKLPSSGGGSVDVEWRRVVQVDWIEPQQIASAVWGATATSYNTAGTMGELENDIADIDTNIDSVKSVVDTNVDIKVSEAWASEAEIHAALDSYWVSKESTVTAVNWNIATIEYALRQMRKFLEEKWEEYMGQIVSEITNGWNLHINDVLSWFKSIESQIKNNKVKIPEIPKWATKEEIAQAVLSVIKDSELKDIASKIIEHDEENTKAFIKKLLEDSEDELYKELKFIFNK